MRRIEVIYLVLLLLGLHTSCNSAEQGCTDPLASNYNPLATEDDDSCIYAIENVSPVWSLELDEQILETSGLILWDGVLWTINDDSDTRIYGLDTSSAEITGTFLLENVVNRDWEELAQDDDYIYIGDFGNNQGNREDLHILRIDKPGLLSGQPYIDTIWFSYSDQHDFESQGLNQSEFDCEALIVSSDSIYLFTKQWLSGHTTQYALPKLPGSFVAQKRGVFDIQGQVTGATYLEPEKLLVVCGYSGLFQPFIFLFYDYQGHDFFSGTRTRLNMTLPFHQVEAIETNDGIHYFLSNERFEKEPYASIPPKLHLFDLSDYLGAYMNGLQ